MIYVNCRSRVLQLCSVNACSSVPQIKRIVSLLNSLYSLFAKRLHVLDEMEQEIDRCSHKLVQTGSTRWLSHEASVDVVALGPPESTTQTPS